MAKTKLKKGSKKAKAAVVTDTPVEATEAVPTKKGVPDALAAARGKPRALKTFRLVLPSGKVHEIANVSSISVVKVGKTFRTKGNIEITTKNGNEKDKWQLNKNGVLYQVV